MLLAWTDEAWGWFKKKNHQRVYPNPHVDQVKRWNEGFVKITDHINQISQDVLRNGTVLIQYLQSSL